MMMIDYSDDDSKTNYRYKNVMIRMLDDDDFNDLVILMIMIYNYCDGRHLIMMVDISDCD